MVNVLGRRVLEVEVGKLEMSGAHDIGLLEEEEERRKSMFALAACGLVLSLDVLGCPSLYPLPKQRPLPPNFLFVHPPPPPPPLQPPSYCRLGVSNTPKCRQKACCIAIFNSSIDNSSPEPSFRSS